ncbi:MAG: hypothetical protein JSR59_07030 [Proteobacteria bacterium]|nr:hypothetical protein [Pseudomonadota bacterium]
MKMIRLSMPKPRNPLVAAARLRHAGTHRPGTGSLRQRAGRALRRELDHLKHSP